MDESDAQQSPLPPAGTAENPYTATQMPVGSGGNLSGQLPPYQMDGRDHGTGGWIPYKNPRALIAYYCGVFGLFPVVGLPIAIAAFVLGILGLKARKANPIIRGSVHAWIGIVLGGISCLYNTFFVVALVAALAANA